MKMKFMQRTSAVPALVAVCGLLLWGCGAKTKYADPESHDARGGIGIASKDLISSVSKGTNDLIQRMEEFRPGGIAPTIAFYSIQNNTNQPINKDMFLRRMRVQMMNEARGKFKFLEEEALKRIDQERANRRAGVVSSDRELKQLYGADYLLTGALDSLTDVEGRHKSNFVQISFRLTDTETGQVVWEFMDEFKKERTEPWWR